MRIATVSRIPIRLHWSFLAFAALYAMSSLASGGMGKLLSTALLVGALFGTVVLHELGHAMAARAWGIRTAAITLYPFGGVTSIAGEPRGPLAELVIALAGPAVNFALAAVFAVPWLALGGGWNVLGELLALNVGMGLFNLVPAFPMDGGRVLRAILSGAFGWVRGTEIALTVGAVFAWAFVGVGVISGQWGLALVGGFLLFALPAERRRLEWRVAQQETAGTRRAWPGPVRTSPPRWTLNPPRIS